ncbi:MAG TPA: DUF2085 domain-containing protein [Pyrinomonadaceae bacterium]|nr:DUF2085 domain-containing protein [Acidobacteriota bacterium]HQZ95436.1 DUF2085 domain-containing protein [Pyrinomonadaceae bacterium]
MRLSKSGGRAAKFFDAPARQASPQIERQSREAAMSEPVENYIPRSIQAAMRRQAWRAWAVGLGVVFVWAFLIILAPLAKAYGFESIAASLNGFYHYICHRIPERSFHIAGEQFGVCSRCSGVYFGLFAGFAIYPLWRRIDEIEPLARFWLFLSMIPIAIDWSLTIFGIWENTQISRVITGLILGIACATYIVPAIVEITRNMTNKRRA